MNKWPRIVCIDGIILIILGIVLLSSLYPARAAGPTPVSIQSLLDMDLPPGKYLRKTRECTASGVSFGAIGVSNWECIDICCYYDARGKELVLDRCEECPKPE